MSTYFCILTSLGAAKMANATALGEVVEFSQMALGDGGGSLPTPDQSQPALVNEVRRAALNSVEIDPDNPTWIVCEQVIPADVGGWTIRETGIYDTDGDLIAVGNFPETYKPVLEEGSGRTQTIRMVIQVSNAATVTLKIDPAVVLATREYVDKKDKAHADATDPHPQYLNNVVRIASSTSEGGIGFWRISHGTEGEKPVGMIEGVMIVTSMGGDFSQEFHSYTDPSVVARRFYKQGNFTEFSYEHNTKNLLKASGADVHAGSSNNSFITPFALQSAGIRSDIGMIVPFPTMTAPPGFLKMQDGELSRTTYAALFSFALASGNMADTEADKAPGQFGPGDGITTFTLPNPQGLVVRALDEMGIYDIGREIGSYQSDAIRNITGYIQGQNEPIFQEEGDIFSGAFYSNEVGFDGYVGGNSSNFGVLSMGFDASRVVPTASENRVKSVAWPMYIKY